MRPSFVSVFIGASILFLGVILFFIWYGYSFSNNHDNLKRPAECINHESTRILFHMKDKGYDLATMIDSFKNSNKNFQLPDSIVTGHAGDESGKVNDCYCCCIEASDYKEIFFDRKPKEVYRIAIEKHRYNAGFNTEYYDDIGFIDIVYTYANSKWHCSLTSKLDTKEKHRVLKRFNTEVLNRLPLIKDKSKD
ncbi:hypothetical protein [Mucilaginibacter flavidus]|uniref:hypothetical protein n=1 Tax=Mucilaginibacter flavidus TaxID=2949309 RepID=UPI00209327D7|nr:hypothetical protein [Mucilaginibacter flavidus]MCO5947157.1 hypothetical protein [Mucilaginibacter flavidus]